METLLQDVRFGLRMIAKRPGFSLVIVLALALGIGANSAIFSVVNSVLLRPLPYKNADRLVWISETNPGADIKEETLSPPNYLDYKSQNQSFEDMGASASTTLTLTSSGEPERMPAAVVTDGFFSTLGVEARLGRTFTPDEDKPGNNRVVILSDGLWKRRFGSDSGIVGSSITLNGNPYTVVGVLPAGFRHPEPGARKAVELWIPLAANYADAARRGDFLSVVARLKPGATVEQARADMATVTARLEQQYPNTNYGWSALLTPLHEHFVGDLRPTLLVLIWAVVFLLLIACANVANLLLARSASRQKEIAIRTALGARRGHIVRQLFVESMLLAILGGALGLLLAVWGVDVLVALSPGNIPRLNEVTVDGRVLGFTLLASLVTGVLFGLFPAVQASRPDLNETLKEGGKGTSEGGSGGRARRALVVAEVALALVPLIGAGLMVRSFMRLQDVDAGFNPDRVMTVELLLPRVRYKEGAQVAAFYKELVEKVKGMPGVQSAATISSLPFQGGDVIAFTIEGRPPLNPGDNVPDGEYRIVSPEYFQTMGIPLLKGRLLSEQDGPDNPMAVVINDKLARQYFPGEDPIGKRINTGDPSRSPWRTIVGVVRDTRLQSLAEEPYAQFYAAHAQVPRTAMALVARTTNDPVALAPLVRSQVSSMDKDLPLYNVRTLEQILAESIAQPRFSMLLMTIFAGVALVLASVGIYGVMSYTVTQRTHEIGIRMALGAQTTSVLSMVVRQGMTLTLMGIGLGLALAYVFTLLTSRVLSKLLFEVGPRDPVAFAGLAAILTGVALVACLIPARRATKVDPMEALRYE